MPALATDYFTEVGIPGTATNLGADYTIGASSITVDTTSGWPTGTGVIFGIDTITTDSDGVETRVEGSYNIFSGVVTSASTIDSLTREFGTAQDYVSGPNTRVYITISSEWANRIVQGILTHADQDGTLKAGAVDVAAVLGNDVVTTAKILDANVTNAKLAAGAGQPGGAWTSWTPTWTNSGTANTLGNGTLTGEYTQVGKTVSYRVRITVGSTTNAGNGTWIFSLPVAAKAAYAAYSKLGDTIVYDLSATTSYYGPAMWLSSTTVVATSVGTAGSYGNVAGISSAAGVPMSYGVGDVVELNGTYEAS